MKQDLAKFSTFALIDASLEDAREFSQSLGASNLYEFEDLKLQDIDQIRIKSYEFSETPNAFLIGKANLESQNALLKLTEEPAVHNYFIFYETEYIIDTLISRAQIVNFNIKPENIYELLEFFKNNDKNGFLKELLNIKNISKQNKAIFLKYLKSLISKLSDNFPQKANILFEEYKNLRTYNLNIDLFIAKLCIELWRT
jgi:DNA polymerase-3 subunit delta'